MRIEREHRNTRSADTEILFQTTMEYHQFLLNQFFGNRSRDLSDRDMCRHQSHPEVILHQNHQ